MNRRARLGAAAAAITVVGVTVSATTLSGDDPVARPASASAECLIVPGSVVVNGQTVLMSCPGSAATTTAPAATTTVAAPTTTTAATTTTTATSTTASTIPVPAGCGLAAVAFCETFDGAAGNGSKTGELNPILWGVSRVGDVNPSQGIVNAISFTSMNGCGPSAFVAAPGDVRICNGQMFETVNDGGGVSSLHTYPKQPFNFALRTGKVVFDVSADSGGTHAAWPEFFITDKPVPGVRGAIGPIPAMAANSIGFALAGCSGGPNDTGVSAFFMTKNNVYSEPPFTTTNCITKGSSSAMNHIEVRVTTNRVEVWGTNAGSTVLKKLATADNLGMSFSQGLVWMNDVHYNAHKGGDGSQANHTFAWDNLGFDGPETYRDLGFDVADANLPGRTSANGDQTVNLGYIIGTGVTLNVPGVNRLQPPTGALVVLNAYSEIASAPSISVNGGPWIDTPWPFPDGQTFSVRSLGIPVPVDEIRDGDNTIAFRSDHWSTVIANVTLILVAGAPVP